MKQVEYQYVSEFKCLKDDCIDTCCSDWLINIDKESYAKLDNILADPDFKNKVTTSIRKTEESDNRYAYIEFQENGYCPFLVEGLCEIQSKYGVELLPSLCATYPKVNNQYFMTSVVSASLSCPEVINTIVRSNNPFAFKFVPKEDVLNTLPQIVNLDRDLRDKLVFTLRDSMINILEQNRSASSDGLLYIITLYALQNSEIYDSTTLRESDFVEINKISEYFQNSDNIELMLNEYQTGSFDISESMLFIISVLMLRASKVDDKFTRMVNETILGIKDHLDIEMDLMDVNLIEENYARVKKAINETDKNRVLKYLSIYINNTIRRENPGKMSNIFLFCYMINIRFSILSFLLYCSAAYPQADLDARFVDVMYLFSRAFDHDATIMTSIYDALSHEGLISMDYATSFLKI